MIAERKKRSLFWRVVHALGSLQLALALLAIIAVACAAATFAESKFTTKIALHYVYNAPWFIFWLALLCVNLFAVTLTRWPWQSKHAGFIITHYGIITLLIGAMIGQQAGFEGNVTLRTDAPPVTRVTTNRSVIQVQNPNDGALYILPFDAEVQKIKPEKARLLPVPGSDLKIVIEETGNVIREPRLAPGDEKTGGAGALLRLRSQMAGQEVPVSLHAVNAPEHDFFGMAKIRLVQGIDAAASAKIQESQMIFSKFAPIAHAHDGAQTGVTARLSEDGSKLILALPDGRSATFSREDATKSEASLGDTSVRVLSYWPDFEMVDGKPSTRSQEPNNPAALVRVSAPEHKAGLDVAVTPEGKVAFASRNASGETFTGSAEKGQTFRIGWADWEAEVLDAGSKAALGSAVVPVAEKSEATLPGIKVALQGGDGSRSEARWLESGNIVSLYQDGQLVNLGYGLETRPLSFSIHLLGFDVPRNEGTDEPADFRAKVRFEGSDGTVESQTRMNHPASYPADWWSMASGFNYKFSQAEWNPRDLNETTFQVLHDPGWLLKWIGSLAICVGIAWMFYFKPYGRKT